MPVEVLDGYHFVGCTFKGIPLPSVVNCKFDNCTFDGVEFGNGPKNDLHSRRHDRMLTSNRSDVHFKKLSFQDCTFSATSVINANVEAIAISGGTINALMFSGCRFDHEFIIKDCNGLPNIQISEDCSFGDAFVETLPDKSKTWQPKWSTIQSIKSLPIPKIGFATLGVVLLLVPIINTLIDVACVSAPACQIGPFSIGRWRLEGDLWLAFWTLIFLTGTSIAHAVVEPDIVGQYHRTKWSKGLNRSRIQFDTFDYSKPKAVWVILICYAVGFMILFWLYISKALPKF